MTTAEEHKIITAREYAVDANKQSPDTFDASATPHLLTDKEQTKTLPCVQCKRACIVTTFLTPAKCLCRECKGEGAGIRGKVAGTLHAVQPGRTQPELAANLPDALINKEFVAAAICPFDGEHKVTLRDIAHSPNYGPRHLNGYDKNGLPQYDQQTGEIATFQCEDCACLIQFSTQQPRQLKRVNEPKTSTRSGPSTLETILGTREDAA